MRQRLTALAACSMIVTMLPLPAAAEYGIQPGSGAVVTAGQPLTVRSAPGWDAPVSYDIADGSWVTVGGDALAAPDGSMWYPVDGGFVPVDGVSSAAPAAPVDNTFEYFQTATDDTWTDPNAVPLDTSGGWTDPTTGEWVTAEVATDQWVDPNAGQEVSGWIDPNTGEWVDATQQAAAETWVDPNAVTDAWVDPNAATETWVDPNAAAPADVAVDTWVDPNAATDGWIDPNTGEWVTSDVAADGWIDPNTGEWVTAAPQELAAAPADTWVDPNAATAAAPADGYVDSVTGQWVVTMAQEAVTDPAAEQYVEPVAEAPVVDTTVSAPAATDEWIDPATTDQTWVDPNAAPATDGAWVDPNTVTTTDGAWVDPNAPVVTDVVAQPDLSGVPATEEWVAPAPQAPVSDNSYGAPIATAYIAGTSGNGVACRVSAEPGSDKIATLGEGEAVEVRGEAIGEWQPVNCSGMGGYINTSYIAWEPAASSMEEVAQKGGKKNRNRGNAGVDGTATSSGQSMVSFAMQYVGYPYAYAGEGPYAFDCSGFTKFVAQNTLGMDITHDMFTQIGMGSSVDRNGLVEGDLVFFANTFRPGLSHTGIYIGGGQFVHAENESTGVVVSDLNSDYYSSRWYGATRLA